MAVCFHLPPPLLRVLLSCDHHILAPNCFRSLLVLSHIPFRLLEHASGSLVRLQSSAVFSQLHFVTFVPSRPIVRFSDVVFIVQ